MLYKRQGTVLCLTAYIFFSSVRSCAKRNPAMPLPVADEGIAGLLQRSENRRSSVSPNDSPGTAKRNPAMPLPVADEGIAGLLQRSENRRSSVSPNDSPGTAKRVAEGEW